MTALCSYPRCSNAAALTTDGLLLQYCDVHAPPASFEEYVPWLRLKDAVVHDPQDAGMQLQRVREPFIVAIEQARQRLEGRQVVLVLPDGSGNSRYLCEYWSYYKHKQIVKLSQTIATACSHQLILEVQLRWGHQPSLPDVPGPTPAPSLNPTAASSGSRPTASSAVTEELPAGYAVCDPPRGDCEEF